jgi:hypothetical protein
MNCPFFCIESLLAVQVGKPSDYAAPPPHFRPAPKGQGVAPFHAVQPPLYQSVPGVSGLVGAGMGASPMVAISGVGLAPPLTAGVSTGMGGEEQRKWQQQQRQLQLLEQQRRSNQQAQPHEQRGVHGGALPRPGGSDGLGPDSHTQLGARPLGVGGGGMSMGMGAMGAMVGSNGWALPPAAGSVGLHERGGGRPGGPPQMMHDPFNSFAAPTPASAKRHPLPSKPHLYTRTGSRMCA